MFGLNWARRQLVIAAVLATVVVVAVTALVIVTRPDGPRLVWSDDFAGPAGAPASESGWTAEQGYFGRPHRSLECMTDDPANASLDGKGHLRIAALRAPNTPCGSTTQNYTSARLTSRSVHRMRYGYLEARAKMAVGSGMWNALWLLGSNYPEVGWPACGEMDIAEVLHQTPTTVYSTLHGPESGGDPTSIGDSQRGASDLSAAFHTYAMDWTPERVRFAVDDIVHLTVTRTQFQKRGRWVFDHDFDVILSLMVGGNWPKAPAAAAVFPQSMTVDYVRVYSAVPRSQ